MLTPEPKVAVCVFHQNIKKYPQRWINTFTESIKNQTNKQFTIYELNYGDGQDRLFDNSVFFSEKQDNHVQAQNLIFDLAYDDGCDLICNTNVDDFYHLDRINKQIQYSKAGFDLISSDFQHIREHSENDILAGKFLMSNLNILDEQSRGHNIIAHPVVALTSGFWERNRPYLEDDYHNGRREDFNLWIRAAQKGEKMLIIPEILLYYRIHANQVGKETNKIPVKIDSIKLTQEKIDILPEIEKIFENFSSIIKFSSNSISEKIRPNLDAIEESLQKIIKIYKNK
tara:strand:- start:7603 stop:8457 length:855 start_codon:yes stop_codon:yes gene_type:complete